MNLKRKFFPLDRNDRNFSKLFPYFSHQNVFLWDNVWAKKLEKISSFVIICLKKDLLSDHQWLMWPPYDTVE